MVYTILTTQQKALRVNLDPRSYGTFAEIGAGQEVAALFFKAGAASGTIAKTMSAYDMTFSDAIYGKEASGRYVVESRLEKMLAHEYELLEERLAGVRPPDTLFFSFANTVVALNYKKTNKGHGWLGIRFQLNPNTEPNELILHINLLDNDTSLQQQVIGILGVNIVYGCFYFFDTPFRLVDSLMDNLSPDRLEIDMIRLTGPDFQSIDNRLLSLHLVKSGFTKAVIFGHNNEVLQSSDVFYNKNILVTRGRFRPPTYANLDMFNSAKEQFEQDKDVQGNEIVQIAELTLSNLTSEGGINERDFLDRADILTSLGQTVLVSNYEEYFRLVNYLSNYTKKKIGIVLGLPAMEYIFDEAYYTDLQGGILEAFATLFSRKVKLYVYPQADPYTEQVRTLQDFVLPEKLVDLFEYLIVNDKLEDIRAKNLEFLHIYSDQVLRMINEGDKEWENLVPAIVANAIKSKRLFGYQPV